MIVEFLKRISCNWDLQINYEYNCNSNYSYFKYKDLINNHKEKENLFFTNWFWKWLKRAKENVKFINRFSIDIDFRKNITFSIDDEDIIEQWIELWNFLKEDSPNDFWQWNYIIFSWNWLHIHYLWDIFEIKEDIKDFALYYKEMTNHIYNEFNNLIWWPFICDLKVWDLGHLFRLPWSYNIKNWIKKECKIIAEQNIKSDFVNKTSYLIKLAKKRLKIKEEEFKKEQLKKQNYNKYYFNNNENLFEIIRKKVDVAQVLLKFIPERTLQNDNKNFKKPWKPWNNSYFVDRWNNIIIRNWSTFLAWNKEWMNPLDIVEEYTWLKWKDMIQWFKDNNFIN